MIRRLLANLRGVQAWIAWVRLVREGDIAGAEALFTERLDPVEVGRQASEGAAILDTVAWLECSGFVDEDRGHLQQYAAWLLAARAAYERQEVTAR